MVDNLIVLFESTATDFTNNGLGVLPDAATCIVTEERNGEFELEMTYPVTGKRYSDLQLRRIIATKSNPYSTHLQAFRIYEITKPINKVVTIKAEHIRYDLSGYPVSRFVSDGIQNTMLALKNSCAITCPFNFTSDKTTESEFSMLEPKSIANILGGESGSILDVYGGEYEFDNFNVKLHNNRGANNGVTIRYGKNLTDLEQEENNSNVYTGIYPYWYSEYDDTYIELTEKIVEAEGTYDYQKILTVDMTEYFSEAPTEDELRSIAERYIEVYEIGVPKVSLDVSFVALSRFDEYKDLELLEKITLCDTVNVIFEELGVSATAKCVETTYNVLTDSYDSIKLGSSSTSLVNTVATQTKVLEETPTKTLMELAIENATNLITGNLGGYVVLRSNADNGIPDEILIMDTNDILTATQVWRWNKSGLGYSSSGYNGPYTTAITQDGKIVADFIQSGTMSANIIQGGTLTLGGANNGHGTLVVKDADDNTIVYINKNGIIVTGAARDYFTQITKDTVTTSYINAKNVTAAEVNCVSGNRKAKVTGGYSKYTWDDVILGNIGTNHWTIDSKDLKGLQFDGELDLDYMTWAAKNSSSGQYVIRWLWNRTANSYAEANSLNAACDLDMHNNTLKNVSWPNGGITGALQFVQVHSVNSDGTPSAWTAGAKMRFVNGILTEATWN